MSGAKMRRQKAAAYLTMLAVLISQSSEAFFLPPTTKSHSSFLHLQHERNHHRQRKVTQHCFRKHRNQTTFLLMSSIGDGNGGAGGSGSNGNGNNNLDDWLDPRKASSESDNLKRARAQMSEESLPINFDESMEEIETTNNDNTANNTNEEGEENISDVESLINEKKELTGKIELLKGDNFKKTPDEIISSNPYLQVVSKLSPSDLISKFTSTAHPRVQDAVRSTVLGLIGTLPKMAFETTTITTGERLASLMFQLQLTGYMLKNADYRLSLSQSLGGMATTNSNGQTQYLLEGDLDGDVDDYEYDEDDEEGRLSEGKVRGKIKITYGKPNDEGTTSSKTEEDSDTKDGDDSDNSTPSMEIEVDAAAYMAELRSEVAKLREDLVTTRKEKEDEVRKDLLLYIRTLPQKELKSLTSTLSDDVLNAMKGLVNVVMAGIGEGQIGPDTVTEQSGEAMAQLCMWQLVVGYNLRELEVREEMKNALRSGSLDNGSGTVKDDANDETNDDADNQESSIDFEKGGFE